MKNSAIKAMFADQFKDARDIDIVFMGNVGTTEEYSIVIYRETTYSTFQVKIEVNETTATD